MSKAAYKQQAVPLCKVFLDIRLKFIKHIGCNILHMDGGINLPDGIPLNIGRIIGNRRLAHQGQLNGLPILCILPDFGIPRDLVLPHLPQEMKIVAVIDHLDIRIVQNIVNIFRSNVRPVQICRRNIVSVLSQPIPDFHLIIASIKHLDPHLL